MMKISVISQVRSTSEISDIFNTGDEIFSVYQKRKKILSRRKLSSANLMGILLGVNIFCT